MQSLLAAQTDLSALNDFVVQEFNVKNQYDYIITCFEPIGKVHGGIGTYTRLLLENSGKSTILLLSATMEAEFFEEFTTKFENISVAVLSRSTLHGKDPINFIGDDYNKFSFNILRYLTALQESGVIFDRVEFPDYGGEGYFAIRAKKAGIIDFNSFVRLHSPHFMLFGDNRKSLLDYEDHHVEMVAYEIKALEETDTILYGNDAMLRHVLEAAEFELNVDLKRKPTFKLPHPWPEFHIKQPSEITKIIAGGKPFRNSKLNIGVIGRLETRKGSVKLAKKLAQATSGGLINHDSIKLHFFGADTEAPGVPSIQTVVSDILSAAGIEAKFWGRLHQVILSETVQACDAIIYPSLFENYPNALIEVLHLPLPILVSTSGGMQEISQAFKNVDSYIPDDMEALARFLSNAEVLKASLSAVKQSADYRNAGSVDLYRKTAKKFNSAITDFLAAHSSGVSLNIASHSTLAGSCSVIIPHYRDFKHLRPAVLSAISQLQQGDEIIIVDDCSGSEYASQEIEFKQWLTVIFNPKLVTLTYLNSPTNGGPGAARNLGGRSSNNDYLLFLDCDDLLAPNAAFRLRSFLDRNQEVDASSGLMKIFGTESHYWCPKDGIKDLILFKNVSHCGIIIRRETFLSTLYSSERQFHYEDWEFMMRLILTGKRFEIIPCVTYFYRVLAGSNSRNRANAEYSGYSQATIIRNSLNFAYSKGLSLSASLLGRMALQTSHLHSPIRHPDSFYVPRSMGEQVVHAGAKAFDGQHFIDTTRVDERALVISGWLATSGRKIRFSSIKDGQAILLEHAEVMRDDVVAHLEKMRSTRHAYGFDLSIPFSHLNLIAAGSMIFVHDEAAVFELGRLNDIIHSALD